MRLRKLYRVSRSLLTGRGRVRRTRRLSPPLKCRGGLVRSVRVELLLPAPLVELVLAVCRRRGCSPNGFIWRAVWRYVSVRPRGVAEIPTCHESWVGVGPRSGDTKIM
jgi:hypothetical protein